MTIPKISSEASGHFFSSSKEVYQSDQDKNIEQLSQRALSSTEGALKTKTGSHQIKPSPSNAKIPPAAQQILARKEEKEPPALTIKFLHPPIEIELNEGQKKFLEKQSRVLELLSSAPFEESQQKTITFSDITADDFKTYVLGAQTCLITSNNVELVLRLADFFDMPHLHKRVEMSLTGDLGRLGDKIKSQGLENKDLTAIRQIVSIARERKWTLEKTCERLFASLLVEAINNQKPELLKDISSWPIHAMELRGTKRSIDLSLFSNMPQLKSLTLENVAISSSSPNKSLPLQSLHLVHCLISDPGFDCLNRCGSLESLYLDNCLDSNTKKIKTEKWKNIQSLIHLRSLVIDSMFLTDNELKFFSQMTKMESLTLSHSQIKGTGLSSLQKMTRLQTLNLSSNPSLTSLKQLAFLKDRPSLQVLDLHRTSINDEELSLIQDMTQLKILYLDYCTKITNEGLSHIKNLISLESLDLSYCTFDDEALEQIKNLPALTSLKLNGLAITDKGLKSLTSLHLQELEMKECHQLTTLKPLKAFYEMKSLDIAGCPLIQKEELEPFKHLIKPGKSLA